MSSREIDPNSNQGRDRRRAKQNDPSYKPVSKKIFFLILAFIIAFSIILLKC